METNRPSFDNKIFGAKTSSDFGAIYDNSPLKTQVRRGEVNLNNALGENIFERDRTTCKYNYNTTHYIKEHRKKNVTLNIGRNML